jgi:hypothetical protein
MTLTVLLVLAAGLASRPGSSPSGAATGRGSAVPGPERARQQTTCALRVVHARPGQDDGILMRQPKQVGDLMVQDAVSPCERP